MSERLRDLIDQINHSHGPDRTQALEVALKEMAQQVMDLTLSVRNLEKKNG